MSESNKEYTAKEIGNALNDWLTYHVITDKKGMIPSVDNYLAFLEKAVKIKEDQAKMVVGYQESTELRPVREATVVSSEKTETSSNKVVSSMDEADIVDPMEALVCDSCQ